MIVYPDGSTEAAQDLVGRYVGLINTDYIMTVLGPLLGDSKETPKEEEPKPVPAPTENDYSKFYSSVSSDGQSLYANYSFTNKDGSSTSSVSPDKVDLLVFLKPE